MKHKHKIAFMQAAWCFANCSVGQRLKVGAVLVKDNGIIAHGYNGLPEALHGPLEDENNVTKAEVRHAEKNALMRLIRRSESAVGASLFVTHQCCFLCSVDIVDAGIKEVYYDQTYRCDKGINHLTNNGVNVYHLPVNIDQGDKHWTLRF